MSSGRSRSGGSCDVDDVQPEVEVLAEAALRRIAASRSRFVADDDAHVDRDPAVASPSGSTTPSCEDAQQLRLQPHGHVADLVEEERAPVALPRSVPTRSALGAGEGAAHVAEELALEELGGDRRAVERHEELVAAAGWRRGWRGRRAPCRCRSRR